MISAPVFVCSSSSKVLWRCRVCRPADGNRAYADVQARQSKPNIAGDYVGVLGGSLHLRLHLRRDTNGAPAAASTAEPGREGPCATFTWEATLSFSVPAVHGTWKGTFRPTAKRLPALGSGEPMPLVFTRDTFVAAAKPSRVDGIWLGTLQAGATSLRSQVHLKSDRTGKEFARSTAWISTRWGSIAATWC